MQRYNNREINSKNLYPLDNIYILRYNMTISETGGI